MCGRYSDYFVVFIGEHGLRAAAIGTGFYAPKGKSTTYEFWFDGNQISRSIIRNFFDGTENELGDLVPSTRSYVKPGFYLDSRFKHQYAKFVGEHPDSVLADETARAAIVRDRSRKFPCVQVSHQRPWVIDCHQRAIRGHERVHGPLLQLGIRFRRVGRIYGRHSAASLRSAQQISSTASTRPLDESTVHEWLATVETQEKFKLSVASGKLQVDWK